MKQTWEHVMKEMKEMEECKKMEESLHKEFPIGEIDIGVDVVTRDKGRHAAGEEILDKDRREDVESSGEVNMERSDKRDFEGCLLRQRAEPCSILVFYVLD